MDLGDFLLRSTKKHCKQENHLTELINNPKLDFSITDFNQHVFINPFAPVKYDFESKKHFIDVSLYRYADLITNICVKTVNDEQEKILDCCLVLNGILFPLSSKTFIPFVALKYCEAKIRIFFIADYFPKTFQITGNNMFANQNMRQFLAIYSLHCSDLMWKIGFETTIVPHSKF